ncbi:hypothetical protein VT50_0214730 [Streptomyces antioxidans]|uniref:Uncharacterized protein n=1 Tax=Streptomyces antioxidans TaxID=1507734 RepID=A0A1V4D5Q8_9ACTN|nr:hypothetical protein [Streptomyces antioxidans]OPF79981.1 hypothetical protein VT50_0214730 [Streptomyces antioxidans]
MAGRGAQLRTEGESGPVQKKQMMVLGVFVVGVLWINHNGDGNTRDGTSPNPHQTARYPVHFEKGTGKKDGGKKDGGKGAEKRPAPRSTVSYPIKSYRR